MPLACASVISFEPAARLHAVLTGLYAWYRDGRQMFANVLRDRALVPAMYALLSDGLDRQLAELGEALVAGLSPSDEAKRRLSATIAIALDFWTWQRMADMGLDDSPTWLSARPRPSSREG